ncbi:MAG TPA: homogentisate 1,2-dioxygenase [Cryomorphaceae bacterium]|jgi:homogentisate 1,2-dioxygenase|nr:MAG: homogentisate 1,2-dioxygenase [Cryomorphaceae bacterium BACL7 MAG-120910-bin2]KRO69251.1 MAG: homogentisate 1,2-dioxygenase [Cryomorphaceae bacterium BACL7 MAG-120322-bin74]KRO82220.1 MAG: homogentisate 1,2-dioxygenase [Cryomorphaceae bacterium BACL7 MAG-121220-bin83]NQW24913.1 homogentisate 1,2-dioxygenase [Cryomorphaceae bacterium]HAB31016.1 homogentisate 1,2-dioxygenase [Cryomorphaceae bacterium]|tara:strand:- start:1127 stop:2284 length:1158 start_codon:yes stop_codon:yes gene_type:complete
MAYYHTLGSIPPKRHTIHEKPEGGLYYEQLFGTEGFHGVSSLLYHTHRPTMISHIGASKDLRPSAAVDKNIHSRMLAGFAATPVDDFLEARTSVLFNNDVQIDVAAPRKGIDNYFYKNADCDEVLFIHEGSGVLRSMFGELRFEYADYIVIPRGTIYQITFDGTQNRLFVVESHSPVVTPKRYRNEVGQMLEHAPFCERDFRLPTYMAPMDARGEFLIQIKKEGILHSVTYSSHPFDVVGWDGYNYPYIFSALNFEPITGRVHQPPPVHQTFEAHNFVICTFAPRMYDYHPKSIPAPYNHSNIDSDEVLYYVDGDFMSRNHVEKGFISLHPGGIPHGPHPGAYERSIGQKETSELAVMVDTFRPLKVTQAALDMEHSDYWSSWNE